MGYKFKRGVDVRPGCWYDCYMIQISKISHLCPGSFTTKDIKRGEIDEPEGEEDNIRPVGEDHRNRLVGGSRRRIADRRVVVCLQSPAKRFDEESRK